MSNYSKDSSDSQEEKNNSTIDIQNLLNRNINYPFWFDFLNENKIENNRLLSVSSHPSTPPLFINNWNESKKSEKNEKQTKETTSIDGKNMSKELLSKKLFNINKNNVEDTPSLTDKSGIKKQDNNLINKKRGRKNQFDDSKRRHNKYSDDNITLKCKHLVLKSVLNFINDRIKFIYNGNIGKSIFIKKLFKTNKKQKSEGHVNFNQNFLKKTIGEIFSDDISIKYTNYPTDHNKKLIQKLENENDESKSIIFKNLFKLTFLQCLEHYRGTKIIEELDGLKCHNEIINNLKDEAEYKKKLNDFLMNFENNINNKKARKSRKKKENKNEKDNN